MTSDSFSNWHARLTLSLLESPAVSSYSYPHPQGVQARPTEKASGGDVAESEDEEDANADPSDGGARGRGWCGMEGSGSG